MENLDKILDEIPAQQLVGFTFEAVFGELLGEFESESEEVHQKAKKRRKKTTEGGELKRLAIGADSFTK